MAFLHAINPDAAAAASPGSPSMDDRSEFVRTMVLLSPEGALLSAKGAEAEEFAAVSAYVTQLARLLGESLGLEGFRELDCEFKGGRCLVYLDRDGNTVGVRPQSEVPLSKIREVLGFLQ